MSLTDRTHTLRWSCNVSGDVGSVRRAQSVNNYLKFIDSFELLSNDLKNKLKQISFVEKILHFNHIHEKKSIKRKSYILLIKPQKIF